MVHKDKLAEKVEFDYEGVLDFKEVLSIIKDFVKRYGYDLIEKIYDTKSKEGLKTTNIKWTFEKELDDYNKATIDFRINLIDYKESYAGGTKAVEGRLQVTAMPIMERDYEEQWKKAPTKKFIRAIYDKYVAKEKQNKADKYLKDTIKDLMKEMKDYFKA